MIIFGLIGFPLDHSWSSSYFSKKFIQEGITDMDYRLFPIRSLEEFPQLISSHRDLAGLNVTIPYKEQILKFLDEIDEPADEIGAVNTIRITRKKGKVFLTGYNTDSDAFRISADFSGHSNALVLGTGGASKAVIHALRKLGIHSLVVSRTPIGPEISYSELNREVIEEHTLIINATPLGMFPEVESLPSVPYHFLSGKHFLYDLTYNPAMTRFLSTGSRYGAKIQNGLKMLENQAEKSFSIWNQKNDE